MKPRRAGTLLMLSGALLCAPRQLAGQNESVLTTLHNLSVSGPGEIRSLTETEVCKFCHIPHNAIVPEPLWGRRLSEVRYETPELRRGRPGARPAPQPDGSSRLCLSCHDGTIALGEIAGRSRPVAMAGGERLGPGRRGFLGTDLSGSHPVSIEISDLSNSVEDDTDMTLRPRAAILQDREIRLDSRGKIQCTTCHDAHADRHYSEGRVPRFWVKPTVDEVCLACHAPG